ncbi:HipA domain-containing protein [Allobaculum sp. JKK-2023]|uniref:type II toxin-antitoxin system HipA family toxin n=1 Tax=Allobaculum sp. JKK-2023 TaxID=3108943 RepID=UPI002B05ED82|nr:HipA domain-containing protein [Allobaculum sp. JKK-2023]
MKKKVRKRIVQVYFDANLCKPILVGSLAIESSHGHEKYFFEYSQDLLKHPWSFCLNPQLEWFSGKQSLDSFHAVDVFLDSVPDHWGRALLKRREELKAEKENGLVPRLLESDFLLGVADFTRMGAFRFSEDDGKSFLGPDEQCCKMPSVADLPRLESMVRFFQMQEHDPGLSELIWLGCSLGGARSKVNVKDEDGFLWIAKFPSTQDKTNMGAWEKTMIDLAVLCQIRVPETELCLSSLFPNQSIFLTKRFDRKGQRRIHFVSAMGLLGQWENQDDEAGYLDLVAFLRSHGSRPREDIQELFWRIVFSFAVNNTDDHLRNHGFLLEKQGWTLSPMYDVNPSLEGHESSLCITPNNPDYTIENLLEFARYADLDQEWASRSIQETCRTVAANWKRIAYTNGLTEQQIKKMEPAFYRAAQVMASQK